MKGFLPYLRRALSPRYCFLSILLLLFSINSIQAKTIVIGGGSGFITVADMTGLNPGDSLAITAGQYSGASFNHLKGITITNNGGTVVFNGQVTLNTLVECVFSGFQFRNVPGTSIRWDGNSRRCTEKNVSFMYCTGIANDANDTIVYNGDTSTLKLYICTFDSLTLFSSSVVFRGSWGDARDQKCYMDSIVFSRIKVDSTLANGTEVAGVIFRLHAHDWKETYKGVITQGGDVGIFMIYGNGSLHNIYRTGGRGYIARIWNVGLKVPGNTYYYNNIDLNTTQYGSLDTKIDETQFTQYVTGGNCYIFNNTVGNKEEHIGYWSSVAVVGSYPSPWVCQVRNNLGFNLQTNGKPPIVANQSNGTWMSDSSNDLYFDKPDGVVDPVTGVPVANSPVLGKGLTLSLVKDDYYHNPRTGAYDIGAVQHGGPVIPPPANLPPVAIGDAARTITLPVSNITLDGTKSYDPDGSIASYSWTMVSGTGVIASPASASTAVTGLTQGLTIFKLTVTDNNNVSSSVLDTILVNPAGNLSPVANAGTDISIILPQNTATLNGSKSADPDGSITSYSWTKISGPNNPVSSGENTAIASLSGLTAGQYNYQLTVTDNNGATGTAQVKITVVSPANVPPVANAGTDQSITAPANSVNLNGSGSYDPDGSISTYNWTLISSQGSVTISNANTAAPSASGLTPGIYTFRLTVTDNSGAVSADDVSVTVIPAAVLPNQEPVANAGFNQVIAAPANSVTLNGSSSFDPDGTIQNYSWTQVSGPSTVTMSNSNAVESTVNGLIVGTYVFQLLVTDNNGATNSDQVTIQVNAAVNKINEAPVAWAGTDTTIYTPAPLFVLNASSSYDPDGNIASYQWQELSGPNEAIASPSIGSQIDVSDLQAGIYQFKVTVTDNQGASATATIKIRVEKDPYSTDQLLVFPNPAHDILNSRITSSITGTVRMVVYDISGRIVLNNESEKTTDQFEKSLNVSGLASGMYTMQVNIANRKTMVTKFIKQ